MLYLSTILLSVFITASLIPIIIKLADKYHMVDFPNPRKVHTIPIPRIGGLAMALGAAVPIVLWTAADAFVMAYLAGAGILVLFGLVDDMKGLGYKTKFTGQFLAALIVVLYGGVRINSLGTLLPDAMLLPEWQCHGPMLHSPARVMGESCCGCSRAISSGVWPRLSAGKVPSIYIRS